VPNLTREEALLLLNDHIGVTVSALLESAEDDEGDD
jgi:hypothetical protein